MPLAATASEQAAAAPPPPSTPIPMRANAPSPVQRFEFTGSGSEYFKIWIVNVLLTDCDARYLLGVGESAPLALLL